MAAFRARIEASKTDNDETNRSTLVAPQRQQKNSTTAREYSHRQHLRSVSRVSQYPMSLPTLAIRNESIKRNQFFVKLSFVCFGLCFSEFVADAS